LLVVSAALTFSLHDVLAALMFSVQVDKGLLMLFFALDQAPSCFHMRAATVNLAWINIFQAAKVKVVKERFLWNVEWQPHLVGAHAVQTETKTIAVVVNEQRHLWIFLLVLASIVEANNFSIKDHETSQWRPPTLNWTVLHSSAGESLLAISAVDSDMVIAICPN
jgi:hypothetical protein